MIFVLIANMYVVYHSFDDLNDDDILLPIKSGMIYVIKLSGFFQIYKFISTAKYMYLTLFAFQLDAGYQFSFAKQIM